MHLAAVLLKQFVKQHWKVDDDGFIHPVASPTEKVQFSLSPYFNCLFECLIRLSFQDLILVLMFYLDNSHFGITGYYSPTSYVVNG